MIARLAMTAVLMLGLGACASLGLSDPVNVNVVGVEPIPGEAMETRFLLKLRVQNPNEQPIDYDGIYVELDVGGSRLATGVSDQRGSVPRFGEKLVELPVSVPVGALLRQAYGLATGERVRADYRLRGRLAGTALGGIRFESSGELQIPPIMLRPSR